jgi:hypothetical protein
MFHKANDLCQPVIAQNRPQDYRCAELCNRMENYEIIPILEFRNVKAMM